MAVEMAKLSLWLVSMDPERPFTFLDDRLVAGDSLLGITALDQLRFMHLDAKKGRAIHEGAPVDFTVGVQTLVDEVAGIRRRIGEVPPGDDPLAALHEKRRLLAEAEAKTGDARFFADLATGAALANAKRGERGLRDGSLAAADLARRVLDGPGDAREEAGRRRAGWLDADHVPGTFDRTPLHWPLVFPEVFERGGFDAIIGNPPFLGGTKITASLGTAYRDHVIETIARGVRAGGRCDLVAYFALRAHDLLNDSGQTGLIATNTLAQGDTREVGLDQLAARGVTFRKAVKSRPWPSKSAALEFSAIWTSQTAIDGAAERVLNDSVVSGITTLLEAESRVAGQPQPLSANGGAVFQGSKLDGVGFTMKPGLASEMIDEDPRNREVLQPYLNGQDLNTQPGFTATRWVVNFLDRSRAEAETYAKPFEHVRRLVKPARASHGEQRVRERWWLYQRPRPERYRAIAGLERVVVITRVSKTVMPVMVSTGQVISEAVVVFATEDTAMLALLSSAPHYWWTIVRGSKRGAGAAPRYTPSDVWETLALPELTGEMRQLGARLDSYRREVMLRRQSGLTATYNLVNDPACQDDDIVELRAIHRSIDEAVCRAYGWDDLLAGGLDHGFHDLGRETRYTVGPAVRQEMVDLLLELNHARYAEEVAAGLHRKKSARVPAQGALFESDTMTRSQRAEP
jgi:hypothetical protein